MKTKILDDIVVVFAATLLLAPLADLSPVFQVSEGREGVVVEEILRSGQYILPLRHAEIIPSKPLLFHWIGSSLARVMGGFDAFALRLPSVLAAIGCVWIVFSTARRLSGRIAGFLASGVLLTTYSFVHLAHDGRVDMLCCFLMTGAICTWLSAASEVSMSGKQPEAIPDTAYAKAGIWCGLAVLAKGPLGIFLPLLVISSVTYWRWGAKGVRSLPRWGWLIAVLLPLPWYISAAHAGRESFLARQLIFENVMRFFGGTGIVPKRPWFYLEVLWTEAAPWSSILVLMGVTRVLFSSASKNRRIFLESPKARFGFTGGLIWILSLLAFFSIAAGKRRAYLLPSLPALALVCGMLLFETFRYAFRSPEDRAKSRIFSRGFMIFGICIWLCIVGLLGFAALEVTSGPRYLICEGCSLHIECLKKVLALKPYVLMAYTLVFLLSALTFWIIGHKRKDIGALAIASGCVLAFIFVPLVEVFVALKGMTHSYEDFSRRVNQIVPADQPLSFIKRRYDESYDALFFYLQRQVSISNPRFPPNEPGWYLASRHWFDQFQSKMDVPPESAAEGGRLVDTAVEKLILFRIPEKR